jgi:hypothetical protein
MLDDGDVDDNSSSYYNFAGFNVTEGETPQLLYRDFLKRIAETLLDLIRHVALFTGSLYVNNTILLTSPPRLSSFSWKAYM